MHLGVNTKKGVCHDWRPGHHSADGSFLKLVSKYRGISFHEAIREVCGIEVDLRSLLRTEETAPEAAPSLIKLPDSTPFASGEGGKIRQIALNYLKSRGVSEEMASSRKLTFTPSKIVFPYFEYGELVYWQSRETLRKVFDFPENTTKDHFIYGFDDVEPCTDVIVTESIFCALALGENAVATGGASMGDMQVRKIKALRPERVILAPDNDDAGKKSLFDNFFKLEPFFSSKIFYSVPPKTSAACGILSGAKDWSEIGEKIGWDKPRKVYEAGLKALNQTELMLGSVRAF